MSAYDDILLFCEDVEGRPSARLPALHDRANKSRLLLASDAYVLAQRGLVAESVIDDLKGPVGYVNTTADLNALVTLYELGWSTFEPVSGIKRSDLEEARRL